MAKITLDETARCACGATLLTARGAVLSMLICACRTCRKATGTGHSTVVLMHANAVRVTGPIKGYATSAASGSAITRHFCSECGTPISARTARAPDLVLIPAGLFDDPHWFMPTQVIFARSHLPWDALADALPRHRTYRDENGF